MLFVQQANKLQNFEISSFVQRTVAPLHHYIMRENVNKSHHLLYLWQQEKTNPNLPLL
jgi:hypothetical protein